MPFIFTPGRLILEEASGSKAANRHVAAPQTVFIIPLMLLAVKERYFCWICWLCIIANGAESVINLRESTIGIIGGGQLARMSAQAAQRLGLQVTILDSDPFCPAAQVTPLQIERDWDSLDGAIELAKRSSTITLENEWVDPANLISAQNAGSKVVPDPQTLAIIGDKLTQRTVFASGDLPSPRFHALDSWDDLSGIASGWGGKVVLKSRTGGYDGYGVKIVSLPFDKYELPQTAAAEWYAEEFIPFDRELAVMVSKNSAGQTSVYPVVESRQTSDGHRCDIVIAPAPGLTGEQSARAQHIALRAVSAVSGIGLFGIELFETGGEFLINEIAPRPHNSGHYTMDGSATSQFEQHIRSIHNVPPGPTDLLAPVVIMVNLLAPWDGEIGIAAASAAAFAACPGVHLHWYGKNEMRKGRKMGHINLLGQTVDATLDLALAARDAFWKGLP